MSVPARNFYNILSPLRLFILYGPLSHTALYSLRGPLPALWPSVSSTASTLYSPLSPLRPSILCRIHLLNVERLNVKWPNTEWPNVERPNIEWLNVAWPNVEWLNVEWLNIKWQRVEKDQTMNDWTQNEWLNVENDINFYKYPLFIVNIVWNFYCFILWYHYYVRLTSVKLCGIIKSLTIFHMIQISIICFHIFLSTFEFFKVWSSDTKLTIVF